VEERSTSPSAGKREGVEPPRTSFEEEEEQGAADRRHYGPPRPPHSLPRRQRPLPVPGPDLERKGSGEEESEREGDRVAPRRAPPEKWRGGNGGRE
jgi:hypothetical protein